MQDIIDVFLLDLHLLKHVLLLFLEPFQLQGKLIGDKLLLCLAFIALKTTDIIRLLRDYYNLGLDILGLLDLRPCLLVLMFNSLNHFDQLCLRKVGQVEFREGLWDGLLISKYYLWCGWLLLNILILH